VAVSSASAVLPCGRSTPRATRETVVTASAALRASWACVQPRFRRYRRTRSAPVEGRLAGALRPMRTVLLANSGLRGIMPHEPGPGNETASPVSTGRAGAPLLVRAWRVAAGLGEGRADP